MGNLLHNIECATCRVKCSILCPSESVRTSEQQIQFPVTFKDIFTLARFLAGGIFFCKLAGLTFIVQEGLLWCQWQAAQTLHISQAFPSLF